MRDNTTKINFLSKIPIFCLVVPHVSKNETWNGQRKISTGWEARGNSESTRDGNKPQPMATLYIQLIISSLV